MTQLSQEQTTEAGSTDPLSSQPSEGASESGNLAETAADGRGEAGEQPPIRDAKGRFLAGHPGRNNGGGRPRKQSHETWLELLPEAKAELIELLHCDSPKVRAAMVALIVMRAEGLVPQTIKLDAEVGRKHAADDLTDDQLLELLARLAQHQGARGRPEASLASLPSQTSHNDDSTNSIATGEGAE